MSQKILEEFVAKFSNDLLVASKATIDGLVDEAIAERVKSYDKSHVYEWYRPEIYTLPEFSKYSRSQLPNIIRVEAIQIIGWDTSSIQNAKQSAAQRGYKFSLNSDSYAHYTRLRHMEDYAHSETHRNTFRLSYRDVKVCITLEGQYFFTEELDYGAEEVFERMMRRKLPVSKDIYDKIIGMTQQQIQEIFHYRGDTPQLIAHWTTVPAEEMGMQMYKSEQLLEEANKMQKNSSRNLKAAEKLHEELAVEREVFEQQCAAKEEQLALREKAIREQEELAAATREKLIRQTAILEKRRADILEKHAKVAAVKNINDIANRLYDILLEAELLTPEYSDRITDLIKLCGNISPSRENSSTAAIAFAIPEITRDVPEKEWSSLVKPE